MRRVFFLGGLMAAGLLLAACGASEPTPTATTVPAPTATATTTPTAIIPLAGEVLAAAALAANELSSFHFDMEVVGGSIPLIDAFHIDKVEGDIVRPDHWRATMVVAVQGQQVESRIIGVGSRTVILHPASGQWINYVTDVDPPGFFHPDRGIQTMLRSVIFPVRLPDSQVDGRSVYHIRGRSGARFFEFLAGSSVPGATVIVDLWIDQEEGFLRQVRIEGRIVKDDSPDIVRLFRLARFNQRILIELPAAAPTPTPVPSTATPRPTPTPTPAPTAIPQEVRDRW